MIRIYLSDRLHNDDESSEWFKALTTGFGNLFQAQQTVPWNEDRKDGNHPAYRDSGAILFVHSNGGEPGWIARAGHIETKCQVVLVRSRGRDVRRSNEKGNLHGCFWSPEEFENRPEVARFITQVKSGDIARIDWSLVEAPRSEALALRLFCDAWEFVEKQEQAGKLSTKDGENILIRRPKSAEEWFSPFCKPPSAGAIIEIGDLMGEAKVAAEELLKAVMKSPQPPLHPFIRAFLIKMTEGKEGT